MVHCPFCGCLLHAQNLALHILEGCTLKAFNDRIHTCPACGVKALSAELMFDHLVKNCVRQRRVARGCCTRLDKQHQMYLAWNSLIIHVKTHHLRPHEQKYDIGVAHPARVEKSEILQPQNVDTDDRVGCPFCQHYFRPQTLALHLLERCEFNMRPRLPQCPACDASALTARMLFHHLVNQCLKQKRPSKVVCLRSHHRILMRTSGSWIEIADHVKEHHFQVSKSKNKIHSEQPKSEDAKFHQKPLSQPKSLDLRTLSLYPERFLAFVRKLHFFAVMHDHVPDYAFHRVFGSWHGDSDGNSEYILDGLERFNLIKRQTICTTVQTIEKEVFIRGMSQTAINRSGQKEIVRSQHTYTYRGFVITPELRALIRPSNNDTSGWHTYVDAYIHILTHILPLFRDQQLQQFFDFEYPALCHIFEQSQPYDDGMLRIKALLVRYVIRYPRLVDLGISLQIQQQPVNPTVQVIPKSVHLHHVERVQWQILPPGAITFERVHRAIQRLSVLHGDVYDPRRLEQINDLVPEQIYIGVHESDFDGYVVFCFAHHRAILECPRRGNAIYALRGSWRTLSRLTKAELLSDHYTHVVTRIVHRGDWLERVKAFINT